MQGEDIETGTVLSTEGIWATVRTNKSKSCRECGKAQAGICGKGGAGMIMKVKNPIRAKKGNTVLLELERKTHIKGYFLAFILPIITLFLSAFTGYILSQFFGIKGIEVAAGFTGLTISIIFSLKKIHKLDKTIQLYITKTLNDLPECENLIGLNPEEMDYLAAFHSKS